MRTARKALFALGQALAAGRRQWASRPPAASATRQPWLAMGLAAAAQAGSALGCVGRAGAPMRRRGMLTLPTSPAPRPPPHMCAQERLAATSTCNTNSGMQGLPSTACAAQAEHSLAPQVVGHKPLTCSSLRFSAAWTVLQQGGGGGQERAGEAAWGGRVRARSACSGCKVARDAACGPR